jgi:hypothetical protein
MLVLTHPENTGVRIYNRNKKYNSQNKRKYLDIIVDKIDKDERTLSLKIKSYKGYEKNITLDIKRPTSYERKMMKIENHPVHYYEFSDFVLTIKDKERSLFFGMPINQSQDRTKEIKICYKMGKFPIEKGIFVGDVFVPVPKEIDYIRNCDVKEAVDAHQYN